MKGHTVVRMLTSAALIVVMTAVAMWGSSGGARAQATGVQIAGFAFTPATITVPVGATVTWTNMDDQQHTTTSDTGVWGSPSLSKGDTFSHTFTQPGTYAYHCAIHPYMTGVVTVESGTGPASPTATATAAPAGAPSPTANPAATSTPQPTATVSAPVPPAPPAGRSLRVSVSGHLRHGHSSSLKVTVRDSASAAPVSGAAVSLDARPEGIAHVVTARTGKSGTATLARLTPLHADKARLTVTKAGYKNRTSSLVVR